MNNEAGTMTERPKGAEPNMLVQEPAPLPQGETVQTAPREIPASVQEPPKPPTVEATGSPVLPNLAPPPARSTDGRLQTTLLFVLLGISVVIVGLLGVIVFRKRQVVETQDDPDESIEAIDAKLRKALSKIG